MTLRIVNYGNDGVFLGNAGCISSTVVTKSHDPLRTYDRPKPALVLQMAADGMPHPYLKNPPPKPLGEPLTEPLREALKEPLRQTLEATHKKNPGSHLYLHSPSA